MRDNFSCSSFETRRLSIPGLISPLCSSELIWILFLFIIRALSPPPARGRKRPGRLLPSSGLLQMASAEELGQLAESPERRLVLAAEEPERIQITTLYFNININVRLSGGRLPLLSLSGATFPC